MSVPLDLWLGLLGGLLGCVDRALDFLHGPERTDGLTLGGTEPKRALFTYWALGGSGMAAVEYLSNLDRLPEGAYFLFAAIEVRSCHGGPGLALGLY